MRVRRVSGVLHTELGYGVKFESQLALVGLQVFGIVVHGQRKEFIKY